MKNISSAVEKLCQNGEACFLYLSSVLSESLLTRCISLGLVQDVLGHAAGTVQAASGQAGGR